MAESTEIENLSVFQDCLSTTLIQKLAPDSSQSNKKRSKGRKNEIKPVVTFTNPENDASELADFVEVAYGTAKTGRARHAEVC